MFKFWIKLEHGSVERTFSTPIEGFQYMKELGRTVVSYEITKV